MVTKLDPLKQHVAQKVSATVVQTVITAVGGILEKSESRSRKLYAP
jgi:hypothetical protein